MDPFARKMLLGAVAFGSAMALMAGALWAVYIHAHPRCSDRVLAQVDSPDDKRTAALMERRCGEEAPFFLHVNLRPAGEALRLGFFSGRAEEGEVFLVEEDTTRVMPVLQWTAPDELTIQCSGCRAALVHKRDERWSSVRLTYQIQP
jgi:hypothetical protein